jgi:hypothetical protein
MVNVLLITLLFFCSIRQKILRGQAKEAYSLQKSTLKYHIEFLVCVSLELLVWFALLKYDYHPTH